jgi:hypothetical protein
MKITVKQKDNKLYVTIKEKELRGKDHAGRRLWETADVIKYLKEHEDYRGYKIVATLKKSVVSNFNPAQHRGQWIFELYKPRPRKTAPPAPVKKRQNPQPSAAPPQKTKKWAGPPRGQRPLKTPSKK